ncbi:MAG: hypothetical protein WDZ77_02790 [Candidatus Pacearchaeota archaeon]
MGNKEIFDVDEDRILFFPDDSINETCLENLLLDASERGLRSKNKVRVVYHRRGRNHTPENPTYENVKKLISVRELKKIYFGIHGEEFSVRKSQGFHGQTFALLTLGRVYNVSD